MTITSVVRVSFWLLLLWTGFLVARHGTTTLLAALPQHMVAATLVVDTSSCGRDVEETEWSCEANGRLSRTSPSIEGSSASLRWRSAEGHYVPTGEEVAVQAFAPPWLPAALGGMLPTAVVPMAEDPRAIALQSLAPDLRLLAMAAVAIVLALGLHVAGRFLRARGPQVLELDDRTSSPGCSLFLLGIGVPLLGLGLGSSFLWGLGLVVLAILTELRRYVIVDRGAGTLTRGWQLFVLRHSAPPTALGSVRGVMLREERGQVHLAISSRQGETEVSRSLDRERVARDAQRLAALLGVPLGVPLGELGSDTAPDASPARSPDEDLVAPHPELPDDLAHAPGLHDPVVSSPRVGRGSIVAERQERSGWWGCGIVLVLAVLVAALLSISDAGDLERWWQQLTGDAVEAPAEAPATP